MYPSLGTTALGHYLLLPPSLLFSVLSFLPSFFNFPVLFALLIFMGTLPTRFYCQLAHHQNFAVKSLIKVLRLMRFLTHSHFPTEESSHSSSQPSFVLLFPSGALDRQMTYAAQLFGKIGRLLVNQAVYSFGFACLLSRLNVPPPHEESLGLDQTAG